MRMPKDYNFKTERSVALNVPYKVRVCLYATTEHDNDPMPTHSFEAIRNYLLAQDSFNQFRFSIEKETLEIKVVETPYRTTASCELLFFMVFSAVNKSNRNERKLVCKMIHSLVRKTLKTVCRPSDKISSSLPKLGFRSRKTRHREPERYLDLYGDIDGSLEDGYSEEEPLFNDNSLEIDEPMNDNSLETNISEDESSEEENEGYKSCVINAAC